MTTNRGPGPVVINLDGLELDNDVWDSPSGVDFKYGGGAYRLTKYHIGGPVMFEFFGAAANTVKLLQQFGVLAAPNDAKPLLVTPPPSLPVPPSETNKEIKQKIVPKKPLSGEISSQYGRYP
jgi:hypothetical protein